MLALILAASVIALPDRTGFVGPGEQANYAGWLATTALDFDAGMSGPCPAATVTSVASNEVHPMDFPASVSAEQVTGLKERVKVEGCGRAMTHNIFVYRTKTGVGNVVLVPGESLAGPRLMSDAAGVAPQVVPEFGKGACDDGSKPVGLWGEAQVISPPDDKGIWMERWPLKVCGLDRPVLITFSPKVGAGTEFTMTLSWR